MQGVALAKAELEREQAVGFERAVGSGDKATVEIEAVGTGEERSGWFVVADFRGECWRVGEWDVRWVRDENVEERVCGDLREQVGLDEGDALREVVLRGILFSDLERCW